MREILFRGKCVDTGKWYEGGYIHLHKTTHCPIGDSERFPDNDIHQIVFERMTDWGIANQHLRVDVNPKTVGQFTGLTDMNGKKIFEGDIVRDMDMYLTHKKYADRGAETEEHAEKYRCSGAVDFVEFMTEDIGSCGCCFPEFKGSGFAAGSVFLGDRCEIIGNIHDNPELLEVE